MLSIVIPLYNEEENVPLLSKGIEEVMADIKDDYEVLCINDGSTDNTEDALNEVATKNTKFKIINLRRNSGQTAAMMAGIDFAKGDIIIPMDGDLQNDPKDIPKLLAKLEEGFDVVSGWRKDRKDNAISRNFPSRIANSLISKISGVHLHDYGCTLKAYRCDVLADIQLYGEMHRFIPIYASWQGGKVCEIIVAHHPRQFGVSKYGLERIVKVVLDLIVIKFLADFHTKPIYIFGSIGIFFMFFSLVSGTYALYLRFFEGIYFIQTPLPLLVMMTFMTGVMCVLMGLIAEILVRTYYEGQNKAIYFIKSTLNILKDDQT